MRFDRRAVLGPALTMVAASSAVLADRHFVAVPNPAPLLVCLVALAGSIGGIGSGLVSAAIAASCMAALLLPHRGLPGYDSADLARLTMLAAAAISTAMITGTLRRKWHDAFDREKKHHATAARLAAALDEVDIGIVLLDTDTRAEFINRAFRNYFALSNAQADSRPPFIALMYHGRDTGAFELPEDELSDFIARRTEMIRSGDTTPIVIKLADGQSLRFRCSVLPDGGRMLSYTPVTDLIRHDDDPHHAEHFRAMRRDRGLIRYLRAAE